MSALAVPVTQLVDLAVNPSLGTVNTLVLHHLFHVIIDRMQLSSSFIEFYGDGSAAIEKLTAVSKRQCQPTIKEFVLRQEMNDPTGNVVEIREEVVRTKTDETAKLFAIRDVKADTKYPLGHPFPPIRVLSAENLQTLQADSIHDTIAGELPSDEAVMSAENPGLTLEAVFNYVNISKRTDALEIGVRQLADILKQTQSEDVKRIDTVRSGIEAQLTTLSTRVDSLVDEIRNFDCKCMSEGFESQLFDDFSTKICREFEDRFVQLQSQMESLEGFSEETSRRLNEESKEFRDLVCGRLDSYQGDLVSCMTEIQEMLDAKLDKIFVPELKQYIEDVKSNLEDKVDSAECSKQLAAGATMRIFTGLNCVSCGERVIQGDTANPPTTIRDESQKRQRRGVANALQLFKLPTRACGERRTSRLESTMSVKVLSEFD